MSQPAVNQLDHLDRELETILTSFDTNYTWQYGTVKEVLRDLYEKAKKEQWNSTTMLDWDTHVEPESEIIPLELGIDEELKYVISLGTITPTAMPPSAHSPDAGT